MKQQIKELDNSCARYCQFRVITTNGQNFSLRCSAGTSETDPTPEEKTLLPMVLESQDYEEIYTRAQVTACISPKSRLKTNSGNPFDWMFGDGRGCNH